MLHNLFNFLGHQSRKFVCTLYLNDLSEKRATPLSVSMM